MEGEWSFGRRPWSPELSGSGVAWDGVIATAGRPRRADHNSRSPGCTGKSPIAAASSHYPGDAVT